MNEPICIADRRCNIGEGPVWNAREGRLYFVNGLGREILMLDIASRTLQARRVTVDVAAIAFDKNHRMLVSRRDGVFILNDDDSVEPICSGVDIQYANDMKVGPDGRLYVGTQSGKRCGVSDKTDGRLYRIDQAGNATVLLDGLRLSNGMEWSMDERRFYHTDSDTGVIKEYEFDRKSGDIAATGRSVAVAGVDGFTIDRNDRIIATGWGQGCFFTIDTKTMRIISQTAVPAKVPASCGFAGDRMDCLAVVTAGLGADLKTDPKAGFTFLYQHPVGGRPPYLFG